MDIIAKEAPIMSFDVLSEVQDMWSFAFMRNAFFAGTIVAIVAGMIGYFVVLRRSSFAAHALSHVGFSGAAAAVLIGVDPVLGLLVFTSGGGVIMGLLGNRSASRDVQIGTVLAFMLGLGVLFISLYDGYASQAYSILFGQMLGISSDEVIMTIAFGTAVIAVLAAIYRPLLFSSLDEDVAEAKGLSMTGIGIAFMLLVAVTVSIAVQVIGVLLIFALTVTPAAIAHRITKRPRNGILISALIALGSTWAGLALAFYYPYPVSFFITTIVFSVYLIVVSTERIRPRFAGRKHDLT